MTNLLTEYALDWLQSRNSEKPFFLFHKAVHYPFKPTPKYRGTYANAEVIRPETATVSKESLAAKPRWLQKRRPGRCEIIPRFSGRWGFEDLYRLYCETLLGLDESVGSILDYLESSGLADQTLTMYMGDNGYQLGEHGLVGKLNAYGNRRFSSPLLKYKMAEDP